MERENSMASDDEMAGIILVEISTKVPTPIADDVSPARCPRLS
jgi:hypothetical protein